MVIVVDLRRFEVNARDGMSDTTALAKWRVLNRLHDRNEVMYYKVPFFLDWFVICFWTQNGGTCCFVGIYGSSILFGYC